ncbi:hypothetical protein SYNPS1DRAFT_24045 [Syncephalis pseudoplumigaleata]|uniref:Glycosyltransferase 61 catalytic domain-containing protein n=1 Tax=Syncephalis pseudoplumigaleata TaxID=1712513 RepID=A0A4P9YVG4_9FUNG|nr:hypothetical protein SYNPS1DRAFT_24045 [Syncephalis pseudoplumigaleata]|eukprot:RKP23874.1 hypothetical protein SYNPS1DRAFT_24045 [Syncephalis pseudoplumigaleata]
MARFVWIVHRLVYIIKSRYCNVYTGFILLVGVCILLARVQQHYLSAVERHNLAEDRLFPNTTAFSLDKLLSAPDAVRLYSAAQLLPTNYTATGYPRERDSTVTARHLCLDAIHGLFRVVDEAGDAANTSPLPEANIVTAGDSFDRFFQAATVTVDAFDAQQRLFARNGRPIHFILLNETTFFLMETYFPSHYSHFLVNNAIPLLEVLGWHYAPDTNRLDYASHLGWMHERRHLYIRDGMQQQEQSSLLQAYRFKHIYRNSASTLPLGTTVCYDTAVLGLNSTCPVGGCVKVPNPALGTYTALRRMTRQHFLPADMVRSLEESDAAAAHSRQPANGGRPRVVVVQRRGTRALLNLEEIEALLRGLDVEYRIVELEHYSMAQQVELFSHTDVLIAVHGNAIGNLFWLPPNALIVEIWQYRWESHWFKYITEQLADERNMKHAIISCGQPECALPSERDLSFDAKDRATKAPIDKLNATLTSHGIKTRAHPS